MGVDKEKNLLVALRPMWKRTAPGEWTESVVGTVEHGETYLSNILKEAREELNLRLAEPDLIYVAKEFHENKNGRMFGTMYAVILNEAKPSIAFDKDEVSQVKWMAHSNIMQQLTNENSRFVNGFDKFYKQVRAKIYSTSHDDH